MRVAFRQSFLRDLKKIGGQAIQARIRRAIEEAEQVSSPSDLRNLKKPSGTESLYRIRVGDYRIGLVFERGTVTFVRCLNRKEIYRYFP